MNPDPPSTAGPPPDAPRRAASRGLEKLRERSPLSILGRVLRPFSAAADLHRKRGTCMPRAPS